MNKDPESWARVSPGVLAASPLDVRGDLVRMAVADIAELHKRTQPQPFKFAPRDGTRIIARCNDGSTMFRLHFDVASGFWKNNTWLGADTLGDGLFLPNGDWILDPFPA